eukprot:TRINITY_DN2850_c0_g1_i2.p2 TRINITY_DN2850_c0_g1~~TRINITY_DN2850_c0_g1_i2.p2  ORF type:complete len:349 (+),score=-11.00 TRINITY_DN2850_c0_g1_i2:143-1189(+)
MQLIHGLKLLIELLHLNGRQEERLKFLDSFLRWQLWYLGTPAFGINKNPLPSHRWSDKQPSPILSQPLDRHQKNIRTRRVSCLLQRCHGLFHWFKHCKHVLLLHVMPFCLLYRYGWARAKLSYQNSPSFLKSLEMSALASFVGTTLSAPFWTLKTRMNLYMQHLSSNNMPKQHGVQIFKHVTKELLINEGPLALYKGYPASLALCSIGIIQMISYEHLMKLFGYRPVVKKAAVPFIAGTLSRFIATTLLYPFTTVRARVQKRQYTLAELKVNQGQEIIYQSVWDCIKKTIRNEGLKAFYKGYLINIIRVAPAQGIFFLLYELTLKLFKQQFYSSLFSLITLIRLLTFI